MTGKRKKLQGSILVKAIVVLFLSITSESVNGLYDHESSSVQTFSSTKDFRHRVLDSAGISLIQFYAPWCGHCQKFAPTFERVASLLEGMVTVGAIDASSDGPLKRVANDHGVTGFPTLKIFKPNVSGGKGSSPTVIDLNEREPSMILNAVMDAVKETIAERASAAPSGGGSSSSRSAKENNVSAVKQLTSSNFDEQVYANPSVVAVAFVAPWCGHCKSLLPEWEAAANYLSASDVMLATVDATVETQLGQEFEVKGFPTIKVFPGGKKTKLDAKDYMGGREKEQIISELLAEVDRSGVPKEIPELVSQDILNETCGGSGENIICVLVALPHILETGAEGRNKYKDIITEASKAVRGMAFEFLWFEGGNHQLNLENALELTFGYPAVAAYSMGKKVYAVHRSSFSDVNLRKFFAGITVGKVPTSPLKEEFVVVETEPWDGKDGVPFEEEPLDDFWDDDDEIMSKGEEL